MVRLAAPLGCPSRRSLLPGSAAGPGGRDAGIMADCASRRAVHHWDRSGTYAGARPTSRRPRSNPSRRLLAFVARSARMRREDGGRALRLPEGSARRATMRPMRTRPAIQTYAAQKPNTRRSCWTGSWTLRPGAAAGHPHPRTLRRNPRTARRRGSNWQQSAEPSAWAARLSNGSTAGPAVCGPFTGTWPRSVQALAATDRPRQRRKPC
jgi:hypothetical protein